MVNQGYSQIRERVNESLQVIANELLKLDDLGADLANLIKAEGDAERKALAERVLADWERTKQGSKPNIRMPLMLYHRVRRGYHELSWLRMRPLNEGVFRTIHLAKGTGLKYTRQLLATYARPFERSIIRRMEDDAGDIRLFWITGGEIRRTLRGYLKSMSAIEKRHAKGTRAALGRGAHPDPEPAEPAHDNSFYVVDTQNHPTPQADVG